MEKTQKVFDFLRKCETYYLATVDGSQPRVRPFGTIDIFEGKLYFLTGRGKQISKQIGINPNVEICAYDGEKWLRLQAAAIDDRRVEAKRHMLEAYPFLRATYDENDENTQVFRLESAVAVISAFDGEPEVIEL